MSCKFNYKGKDYSEAGLIKVLSNDSAIREKYGVQEERPSGNYTIEELSVFKAKVKRLQESMNVEVIMDSTVNSSRVLGKGDPRVKKAGKPVILINPKQLFSTTAIHEFGHIFIDSFPNGIENPRLKRALEQLQGTELEAEIKALYPDLSEEMFAKELITTAIGRKGAEIWDNPSDASTWASIKSWFFSFIQRSLGLNRDEVTELTKELLNNSVRKNNLMANASIESQELRGEKETKSSTDESTSVQSLQRIYNEVLARVNNVHNEYRPDTVQKKIKEALSSEDRTTRFESISELKKELEKLDKADRKLGLAKYIEWVGGEVDQVRINYDKKKALNELSDKKVLASIEWNQSFSTINDIQSLVMSLEDDGEITPAEAKLFSAKIKKIQGNRSDLEIKLLNYARESYAEYMSENNNRLTFEYTTKFEKEYNDLELSASGVSVDQYVMEKLQEYKDIIKDEGYREALKNAEESISDISKMAAVMWSEKNANSADIQVLSTLVDKVERAISEFALNEAREFDFDNKNFRDLSDSSDKDTNSLNQKNKYEGMISVSASGQSYYASQYMPEFLEEKDKYIKRSFDREAADEVYGDIKVTGKALNYEIQDEDGKTHRRLLRFGKGIKYRVETDSDGNSVQISYELQGERVHMPTSQAIARSEYEVWIDANTTTVEVDGRNEPSVLPEKKWINEDYNSLSEKKKDHLTWLKDKIKKGDEKTKGHNSLVSQSFSQEWIRLPGILKTDTQRVLEGNFVSAAKQKLSEISQKQKDDFETQDATNSGLSDSFKRVYADVANQEKLSVAIPFRKKIKSNEQSFDLHTITLMNAVASENYAKKKEAELTFKIILEVMKTRKVPDTANMGKLRKIHMTPEGKDEVALYKDPRNGLSNDAARALDVLVSRMYDIKSVDAGTIKVLGKEKDINQLTKTWLKFSGMTALLFNLPNSIVNASMARINNRIEAFGGEHFNNKDLMKAEYIYLKDMGNVMNDMGTNVDKSRTNMFLSAFNVMGGKEYLDNPFEESTRGQALMKMNNLRPIAKGGEHMMQSHVMYATMNHIKVLNSEGKYLDKDGNVVADKKQAASINEMIEFVPNKITGGVEMRLNEKVSATTFSKTGDRNQIMLETRNLIKYKVRELHGNYDSDLQAAAQRNFIGKLAFFLRKWIEEGYFRRWRGIKTGSKSRKDLTRADQFYSQDAKGIREGYYITAWRFMSKVLVPAIKTLNMEMIKKGTSDLSGHEKANFKKITAELMMIAATMLAYAAMDDDDDETLLIRYALRRQMSELLFFVQPGEAMKIVMSPTASSGTLKNIISAIYQAGDITEEYENGSNIGRNKFEVKALKTLPGLSQTQKDLQGSLDYIESAAGFH